jgi:hypothetical protein
MVMTWFAGFLLLADTGYQPRHRSKRRAGLGIGRLAHRAEDRSSVGVSRPAGPESLTEAIWLASHPAEPGELEQVPGAELGGVRGGLCRASPVSPPGPRKLSLGHRFAGQSPRRGQYPDPPPDELCELLEAGTGLPDTGTWCQTPPDRLRPFPAACPGLVSPMYV